MTTPRGHPATIAPPIGPANPVGPVTYGELLHIAAGHLPGAAAVLAAHPPATALAAARTITAYREVLHALGTHLNALLADRPRRLLLDQTTQDAVTAATVLKAAVLAAVPNRSPRPLPHDSHDTTIGHWIAAARAVRAASDLLATHTSPATTEYRSPHTVRVRYLAERGPVLRHLAALTALAADSEPPLRQLITAIQARDGPVPGHLPDLAAVRDTAHALAGSQPILADPAAYPIIGQATVARPNVRTDHPLAEITDRTAAIRVHAWDLLHTAEPSLDAAVDIARLATQIEATRFRLTAHPQTPLSAVTAPKAGAWHTLWTELRGLRGLTAPNPDIREHTRAVEHLVRNLLHPARTGAAAAIAVGAERRPDTRVDLTDARVRRDLAVVLRHAGDHLAETAPWTHAALHRLARAGHLYVPGQPAEIGEGALTWIGGRPSWAPAVIPRDKIHAVNAAYRELDTAYAHAAVALAPNPGLEPGPVSMQ